MDETNMISFINALSKYDCILKNGPLGTRLKYDYGIKLGSNLTVSDVLETESYRKALAEIYTGDIDIAQQYSIPMIINAATFRASRNHLHYNETRDIKKINMQCINFIKDIKRNYVKPTAPIFIGAPVGSMYDAYSVKKSLTSEKAKQYHLEQIGIFKEAKLDLVSGTALSSLPEALGIALAADQNKLDYTISFILKNEGVLLDGTPLDEAIDCIDSKTQKKPLGFLINCTHPSVISKLSDKNDKYKRLIGIKPNGSDRTPKELSAMTKPVFDSPKEFAESLLQLKKRFGLKIIGCCCGTSKEHLREIAKTCSIGEAI